MQSEDEKAALNAAERKYEEKVRRKVRRMMKELGSDGEPPHYILDNDPRVKVMNEVLAKLARRKVN